MAQPAANCIPADPIFNPVQNFTETFLNDPQLEGLDFKARIIEFSEGNRIKNEENFSKEQAGGLEKALKEEGRKLLLVENLTPKVVNLLHDNWKIPFDFFISHVENSDWYDLPNIQEHLPHLRSVRQNHIRFQFIGTREFDLTRNSDGTLSM
jgi:hypothetical protein